MKVNIHPQWYQDAKVICACGNVFSTGSTIPEIRVEICAHCHPLYTGQQKLVDTLGQVQRYEIKREAAKVKQETRQKIIKTRAAKVESKKEAKPTLKDLLMQIRKQSAS